jgi:hypothetical protein
MPDYEYTTGVISSYKIQHDGVVIRVRIQDSTGSFTNRYLINYPQFITADAGEETQVKLKQNMRLPLLIRTWNLSIS